MSVVLFNNTKLITIKINGRYWTRAKEVCASLKHQRDTSHIIRDHCSMENIRHKYELVAASDSDGPVQWPSDSQKYDLYINEEAMYELAFTSQQDKAKEFRKYCINKLFPQIRDHFEQRKDEEHQLAIEDLGVQFQVEIHESDIQLQELNDENERFYNEIQELRARYVAPLRNLHKNNIIIIVRKHTSSDDDKYHDYPYYIARIQKRKRYVKLRWFTRHFPEHEVIVELSPNSIVNFNRFEEDGHVERKYNHFRLLEDLTRDDLYDMGIPAIDYEDDEE